MDRTELQIDYALAMQDDLAAGGLSEASLMARQEDLRRGLNRLQERFDSGSLGFWGLPEAKGSIERTRDLADRLGDGIDDVLVLGIGGSSLGARAVVHALGSPLAGSGLPHPGPRMHFPDNSDPWHLAALLNALNPERTLTLVISKSGGTVETAAQLLCVRRWLEAGPGPGALPRRLVAITDPEHGSLRKLANELGLATLDIPGNVGGRFSVFTPAGLLPAQLSGVNIEALMAGASRMARRCECQDLRENPAGLLAALHVQHTQELGHDLHVMMPYSDALRPFAAWFVQLWAESLGKRVDRRGQVVETGPTPVPAVGATDQHSQVQLFVEGPRNKLVSFVVIDERGSDLQLPASDGDLAYLQGHSMAELLQAEWRGTALALARAGRPSLSIRLPRLDAGLLGELLFLYEAATAFAGELLDIDAFDQPGVEEGKRLAAGLLGKAGCEQQAEQVRLSEQTRQKRWRC